MPYITETEYARLQELALKGEKTNALEEVLRRYIIYEGAGGYDELSALFGACKHPESSVYMEEWLDRVLRKPAAHAFSNGVLICSCDIEGETVLHGGSCTNCGRPVL